MQAEMLRRNFNLLPGIQRRHPVEVRCGGGGGGGSESLGNM